MWPLEEQADSWARRRVYLAVKASPPSMVLHMKVFNGGPNTGHAQPQNRKEEEQLSARTSE